MFFEISEEEKAIRYLMDNTPKDCLKKVWIAVQNKGSCWSVSVHMCFGTYVRNTLRKGGFDCWADALDNLWSTLIEERLSEWKLQRQTATNVDNPGLKAPRHPSAGA